MKFNWLKRVSSYIRSIGRRKDANLYEAMAEDFKNSKPVITGIDLAEPGSERTVLYQSTTSHTAPYRSTAEATYQQTLRAAAVSRTAARRRGEIDRPQPRATPERRVQASPSHGASYHTQNVTVEDTSTGAYVAAAAALAYSYGNASCDSGSSGSGSCDSGSSDSGSCGCD